MAQLIIDPAGDTVVLQLDAAEDGVEVVQGEGTLLAVRPRPELSGPSHVVDATSKFRQVPFEEDSPA